MKWTDFIENKAKIPIEISAANREFEGILQELILDYSGPVLRMKLDFGVIEILPEKWIGDYNSVSICVQFVATSNVKLNGWSTTNHVSIIFYDLGDSRIAVEFSGDVNIKFECRAIYVDSINPYLQ